jgi:hypothetical protein
VSTPIQLVSISKGAEFSLDLSAFPEAEPEFAYVDDVKCKVEPLSGLVAQGRIKIEGRPPFMWLEGTRDCVLLKALGGAKTASFLSLAVGEFCLEVYHVRPDGDVDLLYQDDFCFK